MTTAIPKFYSYSATWFGITCFLWPYHTKQSILAKLKLQQPSLKRMI